MYLRIVAYEECLQTIAETCSSAFVIQAAGAVSW